MSVFYIGTLYIEETHLKKIKGINRKKCYWEKSHKFVEKIQKNTCNILDIVVNS